MSRTVTITKTGTTPKTASPKITQNVASGRMLNNKLDIRSKRQQLVNTYLTFTYEMRDNLPRRVFWRYVILMLLSIDKIAGISSNDERYSQLFEQTNTLNGTVPLDIQNTWARKFEGIVKNAKRISSSTTKNLNSMLKF
jgi:hypothetical protein